MSKTWFQNSNIAANEWGMYHCTLDRKTLKVDQCANHQTYRGGNWCTAYENYMKSIGPNKIVLLANMRYHLCTTSVYTANKIHANLQRPQIYETAYAYMGWTDASGAWHKVAEAKGTG